MPCRKTARRGCVCLSSDCKALRERLLGRPQKIFDERSSCGKRVSREAKRQTFLRLFLNLLKSFVCFLTEFQRSIRSVHFYPFITVIDKAEISVPQFVST